MYHLLCFKTKMITGTGTISKTAINVPTAGQSILTLNRIKSFPLIPSIAHYNLLSCSF